MGPSLVLSTSSHVCQGTVIGKTVFCWSDLSVARPVITCRTCREISLEDPGLGGS